MSTNASLGDEWLKYSNQGATRNKPMSPELMEMFATFMPELGLSMDVISGGQDAKGEGDRRTGSTRHDHGHAVDADFYLPDGTKLDWNNPDHSAKVTELVQGAKNAGLTGIGGGNDYMGPGRFHIGTGKAGTWGAGGKSANTPEWLKTAYGGMPAGHHEGDGHGHRNAGVQTAARSNNAGINEADKRRGPLFGIGDEMHASLHDKIGGKRMSGMSSGLLSLSGMLMDDSNSGMF